MNQKILIVEDDHTLATTLRRLLEQKLYSCQLAPTLRSTYQLLEEDSFDLVILDRVVTDGDTLEVIEYLQDHASSTRVLCLTQINTLRERIRGLEVGADEYLGKPFAASELLLRVAHLLTKQKLLTAPYFKVGPLSVCPTAGQITFDGQNHTIRKREMEILLCLCRHYNQVITKNQLINEVWGTTRVVPTHNTLDVYIRRIRVHLKHYQHVIKTVRGYGYTVTYPMLSGA